MIAVASVVASSATASGLDLRLPATASAFDVQTTAERIVRAFAAETSVGLGLVDAADIPRVVVRNTANLAYFDHRSGEIVTSHWGTLDEPQRRFFLTITDDDQDQAAELFTSLFNGFLVAHEMTHWLQRRCNLHLDHYTSEAMANDVAVAFFMLLEKGEEQMLALQRRLEQALEHLSDPVPQGEDPVATFNAHYAEIARDPYAYGYYQFLLIIDAIDRRADLSFEWFIRSMCLF